MKPAGGAFLLLLLLCCHQWQQLHAANILFIMGTPMHNNPRWVSPLYEALLGRGHAVTLLSTEPDPKLKDLDFGQLTNSYDIKKKHYINADGGYNHQWDIKQLMIWYESLLGSCHAILENNTKKLKADYDVILYDASYAMDCLLTRLPEYRTTPVVGLSNGKLTQDLLQVVKAENTINIPRVPHFVSQLSVEMSYWERIQNHIFYLAESFLRWGIVMPVLDGMMRNGFAMQDVQLVLLNTHPVLDYVQNMPPNIIEVGGLHIRGESSPLPLSLQDFVDRYTEGIVYISLEHINLLGELGHNAIANMIKEFKQFGFILNVKSSDNVQHVRSFTNMRIIEITGNMQQDILALSHMKAFITHGDSLSLQEAIYNAVPVIVQPLILEELNNAKRIEERYLGIRIPFGQLKADSFLNALSCMVRDEGYVDALQQAQFSFRSRLVKPLNKAIWYIEQLVGDPELFKHLQHPNSRENNFFVKHSFDVLIWPLLFVAVFICNFAILIFFPKKGRSKSFVKIREGKAMEAPVNAEASIKEEMEEKCNAKESQTEEEEFEIEEESQLKEQVQPEESQPKEESLPEECKSEADKKQD